MEEFNLGLDLVEFVMSVEEEFDFDIPDEIRSTLVTPRKVIDYLSFQTSRPRDEIAETVWKFLEYETGIDKSNFTEDSRFIEDMGID